MMDSSRTQRTGNKPENDKLKRQTGNNKPDGNKPENDRRKDYKNCYCEGEH
jgi:hypothetical protein